MVLAALIVVSSGISAHAQSTQVWPEISAFTRLNDRMRFYFLATTVKESQESTEGEFGPNFDFYLRPLRHPKHFGVFRLDESKNRVLLLRVGYRYLHSFSGNPDEHRAVLEATARYPLAAGVLVSHRARVDLQVHRRRGLVAVPQPAVRREGVLDRSREDESLRPGRAVLRQSV